MSSQLFDNLIETFRNWQKADKVRRLANAAADLTGNYSDPKLRGAREDERDARELLEECGRDWLRAEVDKMFEEAREQIKRETGEDPLRLGKR